MKLAHCKEIAVGIPSISGLSGYGYLIENLLLGLDSIGCKLRCYPPDPEIQAQKYLDKRLVTLLQPSNILSKNSPPIFLQVAIPRSLVRPLQKFEFSVCYTMYETNQLPPEYVERINAFDLCLVPSKHNRKIFWESGVRVPIGVVPFGNSQKDFPYLYRDWEISESNPYTFFHVGERDWRKGGDLAVAAFKKLFPKNVQDVRLILKTTLEGEFKPHRSLFVEWSLDPRIHVVRRILTCSEMRLLYRLSHCYLGCTRGEGWGLLIWNALATGCSAIVSHWSSPADFSFLGLPLKVEMTYKDDYYDETTNWGWYGEPNFDHLCELMEFAYKNPHWGKLDGQKAAFHIQNNFTWKRAAERVVQQINYILGDTNIKNL